MSDPEYTPDTDWVRYCYTHYETGEYDQGARERKGATFDRWLAKHDAEVREQYAEEHYYDDWGDDA